MNTETNAGARPADQPVRPQPPAGVSECPTCGYRWRTGQHGGHSCALQLREELEATDKLLAKRDSLLRSIPACEAHGDQCVPHAMEWVQESIKLRKIAEQVLRDMQAQGVLIEWQTVLQEALQLNVGAKLDTTAESK